MKKRFSISLLALLLIFSSCSTNRVERVLELAGTQDNEARIALYEKEAAETGSEKLYYNLAYSLLLEGGYGRAAKVADEALLLFPGSYRFLGLKAYAARESGDLGTYEATLLEMLEEVPADTETMRLLMRLYLWGGFDSKAGYIARNMIQYIPDDPEALFVLSRMNDFYATLSDGDELEKLLEIPVPLPEKRFETILEKRKEASPPFI